MELNKSPAIQNMAEEVTRVIREAAQENLIQDMVVDTNSIQSNGELFSQVIFCCFFFFFFFFFFFSFIFSKGRFAVRIFVDNEWIVWYCYYMNVFVPMKPSQLTGFKLCLVL